MRFSHPPAKVTGAILGTAALIAFTLAAEGCFNSSPPPVGTLEEYEEQGYETTDAYAYGGSLPYWYAPFWYAPPYPYYVGGGGGFAGGGGRPHGGGGGSNGGGSHGHGRH